MCPLYQYECDRCSQTKEDYSSIDNRLNGGSCTCGGCYNLCICPVKTIGHVFTFTPHYDYALGKYFESEDQKKRVLTELGKVQTSGEVCPRGINDRHNKMQVPCTKEEARQIDAGNLNPHAGSDKKITVHARPKGE